MDRDKKGRSLIEFPDTFVVFDIETTGLDPSFFEIIEISALKVEKGVIIDQFDSLIKPEERIDEFITELTGITNEMVAEAPSIEEVLPAFMDFIKDEILIGHNISAFDINFIYDNLEYLGIDLITNDFVDTLRLSRILLPNEKHHRLKDLSKIFNIDSTGSHRALKDSEISLEVYNRLKEMVIKEYGTTQEFIESIKRRNDRKLKAADIKTNKEDFDEDNLFYGKYVVFTGTLEKMQRKEAMQIIADLGGYCQDSITKDTNYLILGNNDLNPQLRGNKSSKQLKAEKMILEGKDIEIISENIFYQNIPNFKKIEKEKVDEIEETEEEDNSVGIPIEEGNFNEKELAIYKIVKEILIKEGKSTELLRCWLSNENYFHISIYYDLLVLKLRGKKDYLVFNDFLNKTYDFSDFEIEKSSSHERGEYRLIIDDTNKMFKLKEYILDCYSRVLKMNNDLVKYSNEGMKNIIDFLKKNYI